MALKEEEQAFRLEYQLHKLLESSFDERQGDDKHQLDGLLKQMGILAPVYKFAKGDPY